MDHILKIVTDFVRKYRYAIGILVLGVVLMLLPGIRTEKENIEQPVQQETQSDLSQELSQILSQIQGVGRVQVLLTVQTGATIVYQQDESGTVIITGQDRQQQGLVEKTEAIQYRGAVVVCEGADSAAVRLNVIEAVSRVTGLSTDKISVLKMK